MPRGPAGGPRPLAEANLVYIVTFSGPSELETNPKKAPEIFEKGSMFPEEDAFQFFVKQIGNVLLGVNHLDTPSRAEVNNIDIEQQTNGRTTWKVEYFLRGEGLGEFGRTMTGAKNLCNAKKVLVEGDNTPIENARKVRRRKFENGPFDVLRITVKAV